MTRKTLSRRVAALANAILAALALGQPVSARSALGFEPEDTSQGAEVFVAVELEGRVSEPGGAPAEGAVVLSSAGGQTVADSRGCFRLEVRVPVEARDVQITAVGRAGGNLLASRRVPVPATAGSVPVGTLTLAPGTACSPAWLPTFGEQPGVGGSVRALTVFDDGGGPALYVGGYFTSAGGLPVNHIAKWDGSTWSALGNGVDDGVRALTVYDDGSGPALYAGGDFDSAGGAAANLVARWDGSTWSALGSGLGGYNVFALTVFDDGGGPALYAGGHIISAGGQSTTAVAKWGGAAWAKVGGGMTGAVYALTVFDDGGGPELYAGGSFFTAGSAPANNVARLRKNGSGWARLGLGTDDVVEALTVFDDGGGPALHAGGRFTMAGGAAANRVAKLMPNGTSWAALGGGVDDEIHALTVYDDGSGPALYAGGRFASAGGAAASRMARWDGSSWAALGSGLNGFLSVRALAVYDDGGVPALFAGGNFTAAGGVPASSIAKWDGSWAALATGTLGGWLNDRVHAVAVYDDGGGPALYAGGRFTSAGGGTADRVARWDGSGWSALGGGLDGAVQALTVYDDGGGPALFAGGDFTSAGGVAANHVAKWDGSSWSALGGGLDGNALELAVYDDGGGPALYVGGNFWSAGGVLSRGLAKWDGSSWTAVGGGVGGSAVFALAVHDDGSGPALFVGGNITAVGGVTANNIARWDGSSWAVLGGGTNLFGDVFTLTSHDDGGGPALYAGGRFTSAGGVPASFVARWDGAGWSALGGGVNNYVHSLASHDDGSGPALYAGGSFTTAGGAAATYIAEWDGSGWAPLGGGVGGHVNALAVFDDGGGPALYAGGSFGSSPAGDSYLARWSCPPGGAGRAYCTAGTSASNCRARISGAGVPSATAASGFDLVATGVEGDKSGLYLFAANGRQARSWGNGTSYQCVAPPVTRATVLAGSGTPGACDGSFTQDLNTLWTSKPSKNPGTGAVVQAQLWYRDPLNTSNRTTSLSDALEFVVGP